MEDRLPDEGVTPPYAKGVPNDDEDVSLADTTHREHQMSELPDSSLASIQCAKAPTNTGTTPSEELPKGHNSMQHDNIWGILIPANPKNLNISRINLYKSQRTYTVGSSPDNDIHFPRSVSISQYSWVGHCHLY